MLLVGSIGRRRRPDRGAGEWWHYISTAYPKSHTCRQHRAAL